MKIEIKKDNQIHGCLWVLMINGQGKQIIFRSQNIDSASEWSKQYIIDNYPKSNRPTWVCTTKENFNKYKWTYGVLDGKWYRAADFTKGIIDTSKVSFKSNKQFKNK